MSLSRIALVAAAAACLSLTTGPSSAANPDPNSTGMLSLRANAIVGLWTAAVSVGPCNGNPTNTIQATINYHSGGTLSETNTMPIKGIPNMQGIPGINQRGPGMGTWSYSPRTGQYTLDIRFNWYVDGVYNGYQHIHRSNVIMSADGKQMGGPVHATRYFADGSKYAEFCGSESATRL